MDRREILERHDGRIERYRPPEPPSTFLLGILGGIALVGLAALMVAAMPDIKRYIKISRM